MKRAWRPKPQQNWTTKELQQLVNCRREGLKSLQIWRQHFMYRSQQSVNNTITRLVAEGLIEKRKPGGGS